MLPARVALQPLLSTPAKAWLLKAGRDIGDRGVNAICWITGQINGRRRM
jgi:hypothetical protein